MVAAALLRVLRMLIAHVELAGRPELVPALRRQIDLLLDILRVTPGLHQEDLERLEATATARVDPADHSAHWAGAPQRTTSSHPVNVNGHRRPPALS
jgi:hypothetical protein